MLEDEATRHMDDEEDIESVDFEMTFDMDRMAGRK
jgi:hypothetical protein